MLIDKDKPFYSIVQVAEILGISSDRLRTYDEQQLVAPARRKNDNKRLYSELDIEWLQDLRSIIAKNRMNIYSFKLALKLINNIPDKKLAELAQTDEIIHLLLKMKNNPNFKKLIH